MSYNGGLHGSNCKECTMEGKTKLVVNMWDLCAAHRRIKCSDCGKEFAFGIKNHGPRCSLCRRIRTVSIRRASKWG